MLRDIGALTKRGYGKGGRNGKCGGEESLQSLFPSLEWLSKGKGATATPPSLVAGK